MTVSSVDSTDSGDAVESVDSHISAAMRILSPSGGIPATTVADRLQRLSIPEPNSGCVLWLGYIDAGGYGRFTVSKQASGKMAHVVAYQTYVGPKPAGLDLDHLCRNRACINPSHLEPVTRRTNVLRGVGPPAVNARKTACKNGHPYDEANTYRSSRGWRACRTCCRAALRRSRAAR